MANARAIESGTTDDLPLTDISVSKHSWGNSEDNAYLPESKQQGHDAGRHTEEGTNGSLDMDSECESADESSPEENRKIMDALKEISKRCTVANPKNRPTSFEVLNILSRVYDPPPEPITIKNLLHKICSREDEAENLTSQTVVGSAQRY